MAKICATPTNRARVSFSCRGMEIRCRWNLLGGLPRKSWKWVAQPPQLQHFNWLSPKCRCLPWYMRGKPRECVYSCTRLYSGRACMRCAGAGTGARVQTDRAETQLMTLSQVPPFRMHS